MTYSAKQQVSGADLLAEGVVEIGACADTNIVFVKTTRRLCLFYADQVASSVPQLSSWGLRRAKEMIDLGYTMAAVSDRFGFNKYRDDLFNQLRGAGLVQGRSRPPSTSQEAREKRRRRAARRTREATSISTG